MQRKVKKLVDQREWMDVDGAAELALAIRQYWERRGYSVSVNLVAVEGAYPRQGPVICVRSDMVAGWPRNATPGTQPQKQAPQP